MKKLFKNCKGSKQQGNIGHLLAMSYYASLGWNISNPVTDSNNYDFIAENLEGKLLKIQAKTTGFKSECGNYVVNLSTSGGNQKEYWRKELSSEIDYIFIVTDEGICYSIPISVLDSMNSLTLYSKYEIYKVMVISTEINIINQKEELVVNQTTKETSKKEYFCSECGTKVTKPESLCKKCSAIKQRKIERPSKEILLNQLASNNTSKIAKFYGVSSSSIRRWLSDYDLPSTRKELKSKGLI